MHDRYISQLGNYVPDIMNMTPDDKLVFLMSYNNGDAEVASFMCKFTNELLTKRAWCLCSTSVSQV